MLKGKLEDSGVLEIFNYIQANKAGGVLEVRRGRHLATFLFKEGRLLNATSTSVDIRLSDILYAAGKITPFQISRAMEIHLKEGRGRRIGTILYEECGVPSAVIQEALTSLYTTIAEDVFKWKKGELTFTGAENLEAYAPDGALFLESGVDTGQLLFLIASKGGK